MYGTGPLWTLSRKPLEWGDFSINMTAPPEWLRPKSQDFFGSSSFDYCVYATSLGYLDFCVGGFTITEKRSSVTTMFETHNDPFYLIVFTEGGGKTSWETFVAATSTIFEPFTASAWAMIFLFALPILGFLMFYHEYGSPGSSYPRTEPIMVQTKGGDRRVVTRPISLVKHIGNSLYTGILSFFQGSYDLSVVTAGGKVNLLAIASFIMLILAVYTANLAAILTQNALQPHVDSLEMAIRQNYTFCAERKLAKNIMDTYGVAPSRFAPDPIHLGGDGQAGFNCPDCQVRERVFEMMQSSHGKGEDTSLYCHAAIAKIEDLQIMHRHGKHCDKMKVGDSLGQSMIGIPIYEENSPALSLLFHKLKTDGVMAKSLHAAQPTNQCPVSANNNEGEGSALTIQQLTGVWVITFGFALIGLMTRWCLCCCGMRSRRKYGNGHQKKNDGDCDYVVQKEHKLRRFDQWLNPPSYDVIVDGYTYDSESNAVERLVDAMADHDLSLNEEGDSTGEEGRFNWRRRRLFDKQCY